MDLRRSRDWNPKPRRNRSKARTILDAPEARNGKGCQGKLGRAPSGPCKADRQDGHQALQVQQLLETCQISRNGEGPALTLLGDMSKYNWKWFGSDFGFALLALSQLKLHRA